MTIDLRSDTFTRPTPEMLEYMFAAPVGDDVFGEDPSVNALEQKTAALFGKEAALFCPSGTMANQIAIKCHTRPGDEVICETMSHVYIYEGGGIAFNSGCQVKPIDGDRGRIRAEQILPHINPPFDYKSRTRLVCVENTTNRGGGSCYAFEELEKIAAVCRENKLGFHLDGARIWNALRVKKETPEQYGSLFDSLSVCLSKGLGAPVGSLVVGSKSFISEARRIRKVMGGGMRQAGYLAAAGIYALDHHRERLDEDHRHAHLISEALLQKPFLKHMLPVESNIIIFTLHDDYPAATLCERLGQQDVKAIAIAPNQVRMVTHLDVTPDMIERLLNIIREL